jgi:hypothetical protein
MDESGNSFNEDDAAHELMKFRPDLVRKNAINQRVDG